MSKRELQTEGKDTGWVDHKGKKLKVGDKIRMRAGKYDKKGTIIGTEMGGGLAYEVPGERGHTTIPAKLRKKFQGYLTLLENTNESSEKIRKMIREEIKAILEGHVHHDFGKFMGDLTNSNTI